MNPESMTDQQLNDAIAREVFGWQSAGNFNFVAGWRERSPRVMYAATQHLHERVSGLIHVDPAIRYGRLYCEAVLKAWRQRKHTPDPEGE